MHTQITSLSGFEKDILPHIEIPNNAKANSVLIESLILRIPLNIVINKDKVIQGADILASYEAFMKDEFILEGTIAPQFKGMKKSDIDAPTIRAIITTSIMLTYIKIDDSIAQTIFNQ